MVSVSKCKRSQEEDSGLEGCHRPVARTAGRVLPLVESELLLQVATAWTQSGAGVLEPFWAQAGTLISAHAPCFLEHVLLGDTGIFSVP